MLRCTLTLTWCTLPLEAREVRGEGGGALGSWSEGGVRAVPGEAQTSSWTAGGRRQGAVGSWSSSELACSRGSLPRLQRTSQINRQHTLSTNNNNYISCLGTYSPTHQTTHYLSVGNHPFAILNMQNPSNMRYCAGSTPHCKIIILRKQHLKVSPHSE